MRKLIITGSAASHLSFPSPDFAPPAARTLSSFCMENFSSPCALKGEREREREFNFPSVALSLCVCKWRRRKLGSRGPNASAVRPSLQEVGLFLSLAIYLIPRFVLVAFPGAFRPASASESCWRRFGMHFAPAYLSSHRQTFIDIEMPRESCVFVAPPFLALPPSHVLHSLVALHPSSAFSFAFFIGRLVADLFHAFPLEREREQQQDDGGTKTSQILYWTPSSPLCHARPSDVNCSIHLPP